MPPPVVKEGMPFSAVTGANGYLGSRIVRGLREAGCPVLELRRDSGDGASGSSRQVLFDLREPLAPEALRDVDVLIHCAYDFGPRRWREIESTNVEGARRLFRLAAEVPNLQIIHISSMSAFAGCRSMYGRAKLEIEAAAADHGGVSIRPGLVWGDEPGGTLGALAKLARLPIIPLVGRGRHRLHLAHEDDLVGLVVSLTCSRQLESVLPIPAAAPTPLSLRTILQHLAVRQGKTTRFLPLPEVVVMALLKLPEALGLRPGLRSDSLVSLVHQDRSPRFGEIERLGASFRAPYLAGPGAALASPNAWSRKGVSAANRDTREFAEQIAADRPRSLIDVGSGSGYLAVRLALDGARVIASDITEAAVRLTVENARRFDVTVETVHTDLLEGIEGRFEAISFNPPFSVGPDGPSVSRIKQFIRRIGPVEAWFMRRMPPPVAAFRRQLIKHFVTQAETRLDPAGALYLLLYRQELAWLAESASPWIVEERASPSLQRRNLACVRLSRPPLPPGR